MKINKSLSLLPQPVKLVIHKGSLRLPHQGYINSPPELRSAAKTTAAITGPQWRLSRSKSETKSALIHFEVDNTLQSQSYSLQISNGGINIAVPDAMAAVYATETLKQIICQSPRHTLPLLRIDDHPSFLVRGVYYDVARGRVPLRDSILKMIEQLARYRINHLQLYIEHTFKFKTHPLIGRGCGGLTTKDISVIDRACLKHHIELVPSLACFGHMNRILQLEPYRDLAEDRAQGSYSDLEAYNAMADWKKRNGWSLSPANPASYKLLEELFADLLPCFTSSYINVCCDEVFDMGMGQSHALRKRIGYDGLFLRHIRKLRAIAAKHGKKIQIWGDMLHIYPEILKRLPKDITVLDWEYSRKVSIDHSQPIANRKLNFYVCPGTSSWVTLFPRLHEATGNIAQMAQSGIKYGAEGLLNTDWGDGGHYNFMELSWPAYLFGAEQAWNPGADRNTFLHRFCKIFMNCDDPRMTEALIQLSDISQTELYGYYQSIMLHIFFAADNRIFALDRPRGEMITVCGGKRRIESDVIVPWGSSIGASHSRQARSAGRKLRILARRQGVDPCKVLPYWIFAADTLTHAGNKLCLLGKGGKPTKAGIKSLIREMQMLKRRFTKLWLKSNRRSEIAISQKRYDNAIGFLKSL